MTMASNPSSNHDRNSDKLNHHGTKYDDNDDDDDDDCYYEPEYEWETITVPWPPSVVAGGGDGDDSSTATNNKTPPPPQQRDFAVLSVLPPPLEYLSTLHTQHQEISGRQVWTGSLLLAQYFLLLGGLDKTSSGDSNHQLPPRAAVWWQQKRQAQPANHCCCGPPSLTVHFSHVLFPIFHGQNSRTRLWHGHSGHDTRSIFRRFPPAPLSESSSSFVSGCGG